MRREFCAFQMFTYVTVPDLTTRFRGETLSTTVSCKLWLIYLPLDYFCAILFPPLLGPLQQIHSLLQCRWGSWGFELSCLTSETVCLRLAPSAVHGLASWASQKKRWSATWEKSEICLINTYLIYIYLLKKIDYFIFMYYSESFTSASQCIIKKDYIPQL